MYPGGDQLDRRRSGCAAQVARDGVVHDGGAGGRSSEFLDRRSGGSEIWVAGGDGDRGAASRGVDSGGAVAARARAAETDVGDGDRMEGACGLLVDRGLRRCAELRTVRLLYVPARDADALPRSERRDS